MHYLYLVYYFAISAFSNSKIITLKDVSTKKDHKENIIKCDKINISQKIYNYYE